MEPILTLVYSYYENAVMFGRQLTEWQSYSDKLRNHLEFIVTDDCSSVKPIRDVIGKAGAGLNIRLFQILKKVPWNWLACRNIGAFHAAAKWILMTDMDHLIQGRHMQTLVNGLQRGKMHPNWIYLFERIDAPNNTHYKPHNDSFLMTKELFWRGGGYDEEMSGNYGTSGPYRRRMFNVAAGNERLQIPLTRYTREVIADASTVGFPRKEGRDPLYVKRLVAKKESEGRPILTLTFPYGELKYGDKD